MGGITGDAARSRFGALSGLLRNYRMRAVLYQLIFVAAVMAAGFYFHANARRNIQRQSIASGFDFLQREAAFDIGESPLPYQPSDSYLRAFVVGAANTIKVSFFGIISAILLGATIGVIRLSGNWLASNLAAAYIELFRNVPLLLQLFFLYALFTERLPHPRQAVNPITGVYLCNRGIYFPVPEFHPAYKWMFLSFCGAVFLTWLFCCRFCQRGERTGTRISGVIITLIVCTTAPAVAWFQFGAPRTIDIPALTGFNFEGGASITPEFGALLLGLILYTSAFIAEIVRSGIESVDRGQAEAARSLGLAPLLVLNLVIIPQALRVIIPPLTNQMLNLIKNSSLAVGIGYPDFVSVVNTSINQTGQAIEGVAMIMALYLFFSLLTSAFMNWHNQRTKWNKT